MFPHSPGSSPPSSWMQPEQTSTPSSVRRRMASLVRRTGFAMGRLCVLPWARQISPSRPSWRRLARCCISRLSGNRKSFACAHPRPPLPLGRRGGLSGRCSGHSKMCTPLLGLSAMKWYCVWCAKRTLPLGIRRCCRPATLHMRFTRRVCDPYSYSMGVTPAVLTAEMQSFPNPPPFALHPHP